DERIEVRRSRTRLAHAQVQGIVKVLFVIGAGIEVHWQQVLRRDTCTRRVELQLADGNAYAVGPEISKAENAAAIGDTDEADVLLRPVLQNFFHLAAACHGEIHAARLAVDVPKLQAGFSDGRVVDDGQKPSRIGHDGSIEQRLIVVQQVDQVNVALKISRLGC